MEPQKFSYLSMGTSWEISIWSDISPALFEVLRERIVIMSNDFDAIYSRFVETSLVWKIAESPGVYEVPVDFTRMLEVYERLYIASGKKLNPLIGFTISDMGYDSHYSLVSSAEIRKTPDFFETVKIIDSTHIETREAVLFDFGAIGKGYFVDKIADVLKAEGFTRYLVNGSGDIYYRGDEPITVGFEHPYDDTKVVGSVLLSNGALCASGINRRTWGKYHHVVDPIKNDSTKGIVATWAVADTATMADALATCLFFVTPDALSDFTYKYCLMNETEMLDRNVDFVS